jgi:Carboxypeptidase regulatory-like domain
LAAAGLLTVPLFLDPSAISQTELPDVEAPAPPRTHTLSGMVVNSVTGEPVRRAMVQAGPTNSGSAISVLTDGEGHFEFAALPESDISVLVHKPGYFSGSELDPSNFEPDVVHLTDDTSTVTLKLLPESVVTGHVATLKGEPIEDSPMRIFREAVSDGYRHWEMRSQAVTDEDGQFRMVGLTPGRYLLATGPNLPIGSALRNRSVHKEGYGTMFYPGVADMDSATVVVIAGGEQVQADFALRLEPVYQVSGTVVGFSPGSGVGVQVASKSGEVIPSPIDVDVQTGKFHGAIPGGSYILQARGSDSTGRLSATDLPVLVNGDVDGVTLPLGSAITIPVSIDLRPTSGASQAVVAADALPVRELAVSAVRLIPTDVRIDNMEFQAEKNERGGLAFHNLVPGHYSVEISATSPWYVRSAVCGTTDLLREELVIAAGRHPDPLEVVLRDDGASLKGKIVSGGRPVGGSVLLFSDQTSLTHARTALIGPGADFEFTSLAPGDYRLLAFDRETLQGLEFRNPEALAPYVAKATTITLHAGDEATLNVERQGADK